MQTQRKYKSNLEKIPKECQAWRNGYKEGMDLVVEIGPGVGLHPIQRAKANPNEFIVAIERTTEKFKKMQSRLSNHKLENLHIVHSDAVSWIYQNIAEGELNKVFILYPNPYPKASQSNKRFIDAPHMDVIFEKIRRGGEIISATNESKYYLELIKSWSGRNNLSIKIRALKSDNYSTHRTHFEKKYLASGQICYDVSAIIN